jgi:hypothetical protein
MNASRQDLMKSLRALGDQARSTAEGEGGTPYTHKRFYAQFNSIAQDLQNESSIEIPLLPVASPFC